MKTVELVIRNMKEFEDFVYGQFGEWNAVVQYLVDECKEYATVEEAVTFIHDLAIHGCISGICTGLIYTADVIDFYHQHIEDVHDVLTEMEDMSGCTIKYTLDDIPVQLVWDAVDYMSTCMNTFLAQFDIEEDDENVSMS